MYDHLSQIEVRTERRGQLTYVSWAEAWGALCKAAPGATFEVHLGQNGTPLHQDQNGAWVSVSVTVGEITHREWLPVLDNRNRPIGDPDAFAVNKAVKRCLAKAIALHGLGLYVYQGEDLPDAEPTNGQARRESTPVELPEHPSMELYKGREAVSGIVPMKSLEAMCTACGLRSEDRDLRLTFAGLVTSRPAPTSFKDMPDADREKVFKSLRYIRDMFSEMSDEEEHTRRHAAIAYLVGKGEAFETGHDFKAALEAFNAGFWQTAKAMEDAV